MSIELTEKEKQRIEEALDSYKVVHPNHRILFATVSGSHLFGTKTDDADIDLRGCYIVPTNELLGLHAPKETTEYEHHEVEFQFHEIGKFIGLLLNSNMNFVEYLHSDLRCVWSNEANNMLELSESIISKEMFAHIQGMSVHTWKHAEKEHFQIPKRNLYLYREILRGLVLFEQGTFLSDVRELALHCGDAEAKNWITYMLDQKKKGLHVEAIYVKKIKDNIAALQSRMLRAREFSTLNAEKHIDERKIDRWLIDVRKMEMN